MKKAAEQQYRYVSLIMVMIVALAIPYAQADDTCMFAVTADEVPPNIVILLDNGAEMQQIAWHAGYDNSVSYLPTPAGAAVNGADDDGDGIVDDAEEDDVVKNKGGGSGFFNDNGYGMQQQGGAYYLVAIQDDLEAGSYSTGIEADSSDGGAGTGTWTINGRTVTLPAEASAAVDAGGIKDNAGLLRYSKNYLNWIFFSGSYDAATDGALPHKSRFYNAKTAILNVAKMASNRASFGIYNFANDEGASNVQPLGMVVDTLAALPENNALDPNFINNVNNMGTNIYSPLAEGLATIGGYYDSPSSHVVGFYCQKNFVIVVSPGVPSADRVGANQYLPKTLEDYDADGTDNDGYGSGDGTLQADSNTYTIPINNMGATWLDDVAHYMYTHDMVGYQVGFQNVITYTVGFMGEYESNLYLINTSNNGNGNPNLYNTSHLEYGKYHFVAESPDELTAVLLDAVNSILSQHMTLTAPVVPVTKTMSSDNIYMAFFKPQEANFWEGNIVKFRINDDLEIVDTNGNPATWPNGAIQEDAVPLWSTRDWAQISAFNTSRTIFTYLSGSKDLKAAAGNQFTTANGNLTDTILGNPTHPLAEIISYIRGADVFDEDADGSTTENREFVTGDVLHSQPVVVQYTYPDDTATSMVYFGANDGMLHAVLDYTDPDIDTTGDETEHGTESWAFISPDQLPRLKDIVEGSGHQYFLDSSPKIYRKDINHNDVLDPGDQVILVCGQRKGGSSYFALDVTDPDNPIFLWRISPGDSFNPDFVISELGQSWSEPQLGLVKTSNSDTLGTPVFFISGGYSADNTAGRAVLAINVFTGAVVKQFINDGYDITEMNYSMPSSVSALDENNNGFVDKVYVGDLGGQMWRIGQFDQDSDGSALEFPESDENINNWTARPFFRAPGYVQDAVTYPRKFYYPPSVTLERGYDLVFMGTGDREMACSQTTAPDRIYSIKDTHSTNLLTETNLVDVTNPAAATPNLETDGDVDGNGEIDRGWYLLLLNASGAGVGEKILAKGTVFYKTYYLTTFVPSPDPCVPGGDANIFALNYKTGAAVLSFGTANPIRNQLIGGGIPSSPVPIITSSGQKLLVSVGSTIPVVGSDSFEAGVMDIDPLAPELNFHYIWWRQL
jgi:type IV pilus assembly protein PilY1